MFLPGATVSLSANIMNSSKKGFKTVFSTPFFEIEENSDPGFPNGLPYYRMTGQDSVLCCLMGEEGLLTMVRQYRPNLGIHTIEFPAGGVESGETPLDAIRREIEEETGYQCTLLNLGTYNLMLNRTNTHDHLFFGMELVPIPNKVSEDGIEMIKVSREELVDMTQNGGYLQLAGLGILQLISIFLGVDILKDPIEKIHKEFRNRLL